MDTVSYLLGKKAGGTPTVLQDKEVNITENGEQTIRADSGYDGLNTVEITTNVPGPTGIINIDANGTYNVANYATAEVQTPSITPEAPEKDVNFYDYDGKRVYSYTTSEFLALNEYPANPTHQGLTAQGWNWDYEDAVNYVTEYGMLDLGQMYTTDDGATRITLDVSDLRNDVYVRIALNGTAEINWGDGSSVEELIGTSTSTNIDAHHVFQKGTYTISIKPIDNCQLKLDYNNERSCCLIYSGDTRKSSINTFYKAGIKEVNMGDNITLSYYGLNGIRNFKLSLPRRNFGTGQYCLSCEAKNIILPPSLTFNSDVMNFNYYSDYNTIIIGNRDSSYSYNRCISTTKKQRRFYITDTSIDTLADGLKLPYVERLIIPKNITTIRSIGLEACKVLDISHHEEIPTLANSTALGSDFPSDCQIVVPDALYENWIVATNWSNYASQIIKKSDFDNQ